MQEKRRGRLLQFLLSFLVWSRGCDYLSDFALQLIEVLHRVLRRHLHPLVLYAKVVHADCGRELFTHVPIEYPFKLSVVLVSLQ